MHKCIGWDIDDWKVANKHYTLLLPSMRKTIHLDCIQLNIKILNCTKIIRYIIIQLSQKALDLRFTQISIYGLRLSFSTAKHKNNNAIIKIYTYLWRQYTTQSYQRHLKSLSAHRPRHWTTIYCMTAIQQHTEKVSLMDMYKRCGNASLSAGQLLWCWWLEWNHRGNRRRRWTHQIRPVSRLPLLWHYIMNLF